MGQLLMTLALLAAVCAPYTLRAETADCVYEAQQKLMERKKKEKYSDLEQKLSLAHECTSVHVNEKEGRVQCYEQGKCLKTELVTDMDCFTYWEYNIRSHRCPKVEVCKEYGPDVLQHEYKLTDVIALTVEKNHLQVSLKGTIIMPADEKPSPQPFSYVYSFYEHGAAQEAAKAFKSHLPLPSSQP